MTQVPTPEYRERFSAALVSEIKADMGRRELSFRGLAALLGENPQYVTSRLGAGNPRTGKRVEMTVADLLVIASALGTTPNKMLDRAKLAAGRPAYWQMPSTAAEIADDELKRRRESRPDVSYPDVRVTPPDTDSEESDAGASLPRVAKRSQEPAGASEFEGE